MPTGKARVSDKPRRIGAAYPKLGEELTERESEVASLLGEGLSNKLIGERVGISEHTAKFHVNNVFTKLGASTRTDAAMRYHMMTHKCVRLESTS